MITPRNALDEQSHLLGFQNKVFDAKMGILRNHKKEDYLTTLLPYDIPDLTDDTSAKTFGFISEGVDVTTHIEKALAIIRCQGHNTKCVHAMRFEVTGPTALYYVRDVETMIASGTRMGNADLVARMQSINNRAYLREEWESCKHAYANLERKLERLAAGNAL